MENKAPDLSSTFNWHVRTIIFSGLRQSMALGGTPCRHQMVIDTYDPETDRERGVIIISGRAENPNDWFRFNSESLGGADHIGAPQQLCKVNLIEVTPCGPDHHSVRIEMTSGDVVETTLIDMDFGCEGRRPNGEFVLTPSRGIRDHADYHARDGVVLFSTLDLL